MNPSGMKMNGWSVVAPCLLVLQKIGYDRIYETTIPVPAPTSSEGVSSD